MYLLLWTHQYTSRVANRCAFFFLVVTNRWWADAGAAAGATFREEDPARWEVVPDPDTGTATGRGGSRSGRRRGRRSRGASCGVLTNYGCSFSVIQTIVGRLSTADTVTGTAIGADE